MHDGCNARAWVAVEVEPDNVPLPQAAPRFLTRVDGPAARRSPAPGQPRTSDALRGAGEWFEPVVACDADPRRARRHSCSRSTTRCCFYTWGDRPMLPARRRQPQPTLAAGTAHAELLRGDVLLFEEVHGPETGVAGRRRPRAPPRGAAEPTVEHIQDRRSADGPAARPPITEIAWAAADALPFPLCISLAGPSPGSPAERRASPRGQPACSPTTARSSRTSALTVAARRSLGSTATDDARSRRPAVPARLRAPCRSAASPRPVRSEGRPARAASAGRARCDPDAAGDLGARLDARRDVARHPALEQTTGDERTAWTARSGPARQRPRRSGLRRRDRRRRARQLRFGDDVQGAPADAGDGVHATLPHRQRPRRQRRRRRDRATSVTAGWRGSLPVRNPLPAARRHRPGDRSTQVRRRAPQAFRTPGARGHAGRLRGGDRAPCPDGPARGGDAPLDRQLAHRVRHRRPLGRRADGRRRSRPRSAPRRALPHGRPRPRSSTIRASCRSSSSSPSAWPGLLPQRRRSGRCSRRAQPPRAARRHAAACSIPTTSASASRST